MGGRSRRRHPAPRSRHIPSRDGAWRRYCQVRRRSKWISLRSRLFKSQHQGLTFVGSSQLAVYFLHAFVYKMLSCRPSHRGPASRAGSTVPKKVAPANPSSTSDPNGYSSFLQYIDVAPAQSGPLKVPN